VTVVDTAWDGSASRYTDAEWEAACALDRKNCSTEWEDKPPKERCSLPFKEPNGDINSKGVAAAAGRLSSVTDACDTAINAAKGKLRSAYHDIGTDPPDSVKTAPVPDGKRTERKEFRVDVPFTKQLSPSKGDLVISGYASTWGIDRDGECIHPEAFDGSLEAYLKNNPIMLWQHDQDCPFGSVTKAETDDTGLYIEAVIPKPAENEPAWLHLAYNKMAQGIVRTFSIGGYMTLMWDSDLESPVIVKVELCEISVVSIPANETSIFTVAVKAIKGLDVVKAHLTPSVIEQMEQVTGIAELSDPELVGMKKPDLEERYRMLAAVYKAAGAEAPDFDEFERAKAVQSPLARLEAVTTAMSKAKGAQVVMKAGRVLSKSNEKTIRDAMEQVAQAQATLKSILDQLPDAPASAGDGESHSTIIEQAALPPATATAPIG
jgi:HK97 family phage prohead protease